MELPVKEERPPLELPREPRDESPPRPELALPSPVEVPVRPPVELPKEPREDRPLDWRFSYSLPDRPADGEPVKGLAMADGVTPVAEPLEAPSPPRLPKSPARPDDSPPDEAPPSVPAPKPPMLPAPEDPDEDPRPPSPARPPASVPEALPALLPRPLNPPLAEEGKVPVLMGALGMTPDEPEPAMPEGRRPADPEPVEPLLPRPPRPARPPEERPLGSAAPVRKG